MDTITPPPAQADPPLTIERTPALPAAGVVGPSPTELNALSLEERKALHEGEFMSAFRASAIEHVGWIFWTRPTTEPTTFLNQGSVFMLDRGAGPMLVTAAHVYDGYLEQRVEHGDLYCQVMNCRVKDLSRWLIDRGDWQAGGPDIATFRLPDGAADRIGKRPIVAPPAGWPPPPNAGELTMFSGFPAEECFAVSPDEVSFGFHCGMLPVTSLTDQQITCRFNRETMVAMPGGTLPPVGHNLGGLSGGPLLVPDYRDGAYFWRLGGVVSEAGSSELLESVVSHRAEYILPDGRLERLR